MMMKPFLRKRPSSPTFHPCCRHRDPINPSQRVGYVTANIFEALPPEKLASASHMVLTLETVTGSVVTTILSEWRSGDSESWIFRKLSYQKLQVFRIERKIGIEVADYIELKRSGLFQAGIECTDLSSKASVNPLWPPHQVDPWTAGRVALHNFGCPIGGAIVHNDPQFGQDRLRDHGGEGLFNKRFFIVCGSDQNVLHATARGLRSVTSLIRYTVTT
jgi:hypothetical protein